MDNPPPFKIEIVQELSPNCQRFGADGIRELIRKKKIELIEVGITPAQANIIIDSIALGWQISGCGKLWKMKYKGAFIAYIKDTTK